MVSKGRLLDIGRDFRTGRTRLTVEVDTKPETAEKLLDKELTVKITQYRKKRSLDANNYLWLLLGEIQAVLQNGSTKEELYMRALMTFGTFMYLPATEEEAEELRKVFRIVIDRGESPLKTRSGKEVDVHTYQCYKGSSLYDTKEMSVLLSGVIRTAEELGIDTVTPEEKERMIQQWHIAD